MGRSRTVRLARSLLREIRNYLFPYRPFAGVYSSFEEAMGASQPQHFATAQSASEAVIGASGSLARHSPLGIPDLHVRAKNLLPAIIAALQKGDAALRVLDFGGGAGIDFCNVVAACGERAANIQYTVVEFPETCVKARTLWEHEPRISFVESLPLAGEFDLVCAWGAIQYVEDVAALLRQFAAYSPRAIVIQWTPFSEKAFVRLQRNTASPIPQHVLGFAATVDLMDSLGYNLAFKSWSDCSYDVDNFDPDHRVSGAPDLLFTRR